MKTKPRRRLKVTSRESCMDACLIERDFECRSANWHRLTGECNLSDQDRHSVSQSEAGDQQIKSSLGNFYGPTNSLNSSLMVAAATSAPFSFGLYGKQNNQQQFMSAATGPSLADKSRLNSQPTMSGDNPTSAGNQFNHLLRPIENSRRRQRRQVHQHHHNHHHHHHQVMNQLSGAHQMAGSSGNEHEWQHYIDMPANAVVDYLENNCIYEPNKLCEFRKIQNRILKTVDSIYQDVATLEECKQKCLNAPYRCYSFDYGDTSEKVCRTSHLDQASLLSVKEPYLEVVGAITYELAACFNVSIQCRAKEMVAYVSSSKSFRGKIYVKSRPLSCVNDVKEALQFELSMRYHDDSCDVRATSNQQKGVFSSDLVIQHHDRIMTTQDVGLSVYCQYDLGNRSVTNNVDLAIDRIPDGPVESKQSASSSPAAGNTGTAGQQQQQPPLSPLTITGLATTVVKSPNVTMRITNMNGQPVSSATVGDRLALLFEVQEKSSPFGIFVREIVAMDGRQLLTTLQQQQQQQQQIIANNNNPTSSKNDNNQLKLGSNGRNYYNSLMPGGGYHYASGPNELLNNETTRVDSLLATSANSIQFIDSDGCPTDANLMGPLVKMDPSGHRLLAPFDAFKFPTSDMVFFRAVVTSCLAECKPAVCPALGNSPGSSSGGPLAAPQLMQDTTYQTPATTSASTSSESSYLLTSRMTSAPSTTITTTTTTTTTANPTTSTPTTTIITTMPTNLSELTRTPETNLAGQRQPSMETLVESESFGRSTVGGDSAGTTVADQRIDSTQGMTIVVPGFANSDAAAAATTTTAAPTTANPTWPTPTAGLSATTASQLLADLLHQVNMTNNHNGKPRPATTVGLPSASFQSNNNNNVDPIGQMTSLLELASMTPEQKQQILESFEAKLRQKFKPMQHQTPLIINGTNAPDLADLSDLYTGLLSSLMSPPSMANGANKPTNNVDDETNNRTNRTLGEQLSGVFVSLLNSKLNQRLQLEANKVSGGGGDSTMADYDKTSANKLATASEQRQQQTSLQESNNKTTQQQQQEIKFQQPANRSQKKRDKTANLQALADSYLGAYQSFGRRRKRDTRRDDLHSHASNHYVYMEQPQIEEVAPMVPSFRPQKTGARFTQAIVEMYHTKADDDLEHVKLARFRRHATTFEQTAAPIADTEELIVQSIKIVDRLQFNDEKQQQQQQKKITNQDANFAPNQRAARSDLVTSGLNRKPFGWPGPSSSRSSSRPRNGQELEANMSNDDDDDEKGHLLNDIRSSSSLSAFSVFLVAMCFVFVQISMVLVCLVDWGRLRPRTAPRSSSVASSIDIDCSNPFDGSTILSSHHSDSVSTSSIMTPTTILSNNDFSYNNRSPVQPTPTEHSIGYNINNINYHYPTMAARRGRREERIMGTLIRQNPASEYLNYSG